MNIDYYREFLELARCLNFTEAAEKLHITQPALSKHISALEKEFDTILFIRNRRAVQLSESGRILYGSATNFVTMYDQTKAAIEKLEKNSPIRVDGVLYDNTVSSIISLTSVLLNDGPHTPIIFNHQEDVSFIDLLERDEVDLIFAYDNENLLEKKGFVFKPLLRSQFIAVLDKTHPLASRLTLSIDDLRDETFVQFIDEYSLPGWRRIEEVCESHGFVPKTRPVLGRTVMGYATTPPDGGVLILQKNLRWIKFLTDAKQLPCIPIIDEDAVFIINCIYKKENEERLSTLLNALEESRDIILNHRTTHPPE